MTALLAPEPIVSKPRSGGPKTQAGKDASRRNALKHGMRAEVVLPDEMAAGVAERTAKLCDEMHPNTPYETFLVGQIALASIRIERCVELETAALERLAERALVCWDADRRQDVESVGAKLSQQPGRTVAILETTSHGAAWLIERWEGLRLALIQNGGWSQAQRGLALDLLGVPEALRDCCPRVPEDADAPTLTTLVDRQLSDLNARRSDVLAPLDDAERERASAGFPITDDPTVRMIRRWETSAQRLLFRSDDELRRRQRAANPDGPAPAPVAAPKPVVAPPPRPAASERPEPLSSPPALAATLASIIDTPAPPPLNRKARRAQAKNARKAAGFR